jgi:hypothetical protein
VLGCAFESTYGSGEGPWQFGAPAFVGRLLQDFARHTEGTPKNGNGFIGEGFCDRRIQLWLRGRERANVSPMIFARFVLRPEFDPDPGQLLIELHPCYGPSAIDAHQAVQRLFIRAGDHAQIRDRLGELWPMAAGSVASFWVWKCEGTLISR